MSAFKSRTFTNGIIQARVDFDEAISRIADEYRREVLIPLCRRHKLEFYSGNGTFAFFTTDGRHTGDPLDAKRQHMSYLIPALKVLSEEIDSVNFFGFYVGRIIASDY